LTGGEHHFYIDDIDKFTIDSTGYVGIGTTSPDARLTVDGNIYPNENGTSYLGTTTRYWKDASFIDENGQVFSVNDITKAQRRIRENTSYLDYSISDTISGGVWTYTITDTSGNGFFAFNLDKKVLIKVAATMTVDIESYAGTDASPKTIFIYVQNDGSDNPEMVASNISPEGVVEHVDIGTVKAGTVSDSTVTDYGSYSSELWAEGFVFNTFHRFWHDGAQYRSGMDIQADSGDVRIGTGTMAIIYDEITTYYASTSVDTLFYSLNDDTYATSTTYDFSGEYSTGESITSNKYFNVVLGIIPVNSSNSRIFALVQSGSVIPSGREYTSVALAIEDRYGATTYQPSDDLLKKIWIPVARVIVKNTGTGVLQEIPESGTGIYYIDIRNQAVGGGAGASPIVSGEWGSDATSIFQNNTDLNVLIGTSTGTYKLDVFGNVRFQGTATTTNLTVTTNSKLGTIVSGTWNGTAIGVDYGGTGKTSYTPGDMLYADSPTSFGIIASSTDGYVLQLDTNGIPEWVATSTLGFPAGAESTTASDGLTVSGVNVQPASGYEMLLTASTTALRFDDPAFFATSSLIYFSGATTTIELGMSINAELWEYGICKATVGTADIRCGDSNTWSALYSLTNATSSNAFGYTFAEGDERQCEIGNVSSNNTGVTCTFRQIWQ